jgi:predicted ATPase
MQKIIIKNFGPIKDAEIDVSPVLVLIGEQASGKSTVSKLIYFFKSLSDVLFDNFYESDSNQLNILQDFVFPVRNKFYDFFGSTKHLEKFEIIYEYDREVFIQLTQDDEKKLKITPSKTLFNQQFKNQLRGAKELNSQLEQNASDPILSPRVRLTKENEKSKAVKQISKLIDDRFNNHHTSSLFTIAGRESTVSYEMTFESFLEFTLKNFLFESRKENKMKAKQQTIEETLMLDFLMENRRIKDIFKKYGGSFESLFENFSENDKSLNQYDDFVKKVSEILKGNYEMTERGEKITFGNGQYVYLKDASSGQKEVIRILQDLAICIIENKSALRIIEEPEAHLFPSAQKSLMEALLFMKNINPYNQLIITTHSPYILTVLNNFLYACRLSHKYPSLKEELSKIVPESVQIDPGQFRAYSLSKNENNDSYGNHICSSIFDDKTGTIAQNYLDLVSEELGEDFYRLYSIHAKSLQSK